MMIKTTKVLSYIFIVAVILLCGCSPKNVDSDPESTSVITHVITENKNGVSAEFSSEMPKAGSDPEIVAMGCILIVFVIAFLLLCGRSFENTDSDPESTSVIAHVAAKNKNGVSAEFSSKMPEADGDTYGTARIADQGDANGNCSTETTNLSFM